MQQICIFGIGRTSLYLLEYLSRKSVQNNWKILACDMDRVSIEDKIQNLLNCNAVQVDVLDTAAIKPLIEQSDIVVSLLPPTMHMHIAELCLATNTHMATASYVSPEMKKLQGQVKNQKLIFLNEIGLDPGLDHMSAMQMLETIRNNGGEITAFESHTGGLISLADCSGNPWQYKFTWNPMNVVLAGQGGMSVYKENNMVRLLPWHALFADYRPITIPRIGDFEVYPNRDSLAYETEYGLEDASTILRGTLRRSGYCNGWQYLVKLGFTDNTLVLPKHIKSVADLTLALTGIDPNQTLSAFLNRTYGMPEMLNNHIDFLDLQNTEEIEIANPTPASFLLHCLQNKWQLEASDRDEIIMYHKVSYRLNNLEQTQFSVLQCMGTDSKHTAMAKTVGLPLAMGVELILQDKITIAGVQIPVTAEWYNPILAGLANEGIVFQDAR